MPEGLMKAHRRRLNATARRLLYEEGKPWQQALAEAMERLQCGARTRAGHPCRRKGGALAAVVRSTADRYGRQNAGRPGEAQPNRTIIAAWSGWPVPKINHNGGDERMFDLINLKTGRIRILIR